MKSEFKIGTVAVAGLPNVGKSSLINQLVGEKVGIVSEKPQTTRKRVVGIYTSDECQLMFVDAPGFIRAESGLNKFIQDEADSVCKSADIILLVMSTDMKSLRPVERAIEKMKEMNKPWFVILNKMDENKLHRVVLLEKFVTDNEVPFIKHSTVDSGYDQSAVIIEKICETSLRTGTPLHDPDAFTTARTRDWVSEVIREKCFELLHQELPFNIAIQVKKFDETDQNCLRIFADIVVAKKNHISIVVGKEGSKIKEIGMNSRKEIENLLGQKIFLKLFTKVKSDWTTNKSFLKELGYVVKGK